MIVSCFALLLFLMATLTFLPHPSPSAHLFPMSELISFPSFFPTRPHSRPIHLHLSDPEFLFTLPHSFSTPPAPILLSLHPFNS
jgi:hypothetical protein